MNVRKFANEWGTRAPGKQVSEPKVKAGTRHRVLRPGELQELDKLVLVRVPP